MRYIFDTTDTEGVIGMQIAKWAKEDKLTLIEKGEPLIEIKESMERVARALDLLKNAGYDREVMEIFLRVKTGLTASKVRNMLDQQDEFFRQIGVLK